jgi:hypothetical protein
MPRLLIRCIAALALALMAATVSVAVAHDEQRPATVSDVSLELVGQVINSAPGVTPATSVQFGYVSQLSDLPIFNAGSQNESTALLTFYTDTTTSRVVNNGPLRIVSRTGRLTIYRDPSANGDFANPDSFRDGMPVLATVLRQQVILNTLTGAFTAHNVNTITSTSAFELGNDQVVLGRIGGRFHTAISGQLATAAPPSAYIAGYTFSTEAPAWRSRGNVW